MDMRLVVHHPTMPFWSELDRLLLCGGEMIRWLNKEPGASLWPWASDNPTVQTVWEQLTHPENLSALMDWGRDLERMNDYAFSCTAIAIETCRLRGVRSGVVRSVEECTPEALEAYHRQYGQRAATETAPA